MRGRDLTTKQGAHRAGRLVAILALGLLAAAGCSSWGVRTDLAAGPELAQARTYAWQPDQSDSSFGRSLAGQRVREMLDQGLAARGLQQARPGEVPDLLLTARYEAEPQLVAFSSGWSNWYDWGGGWDTIYPYTRGTLTVELVDPRTRNVVWHAAARKDKIERDMDRNDVSSAVNKILARYPPWLGR